LTSPHPPIANPIFAEAADWAAANFPATIPTRLNPLAGIYTDGSCIKDGETGGNKLGAAVYDARNAWSLHIDPAGRDATNTITRAELSAIHQALIHVDRQGRLHRTVPEADDMDIDYNDALRDDMETDLPAAQNTEGQDPELHIYTDSLASLQLIRKTLREPYLLRESKHLDILRNIRSRILHRARMGLRTCLYKVKSHSGVHGNTAADSAAVAVATGEVEAACTELSDSEPYRRLWWLASGERFLANLTRAVKDAVGHATAPGPCANDTTYGALWDDVESDLDGPSSNGMWTATGVKFETATQMLKCRWGHLYNQKLAHRYGRAPTPACPLCGAEDSGPHILGGCTHPTMQGHINNRHNAAVRRVAKMVHRGALSGRYMTMDAGAEPNPPYIDKSATIVPAWMLPQVPFNELKKMRPDILVIDGMALESAQREDLTEAADLADFAPRPNDAYTVHLVEVGYCGDLNHARKREEKQEQHTRLIAALQARGWAVKLHVITLGHSGTLPKYLHKTLMDLGATSTAAKACAAKLHIHAVQKAKDMIAVRRMMERQQQHPAAATHPP
jgi:ribonuclease HI